MSKRSNRWLACAALLAAGLAVGVWGAAAQGNQPQAVPNATAAQADVKIQQLKAVIPDAPAVADRPTLLLMSEVAGTKRPEAAALLVKALAFNLDPDSSDERLSLPDMIPAINLLKHSFGESSATTLYEEAIGSERKWYRDRIALAVRSILAPKTIKEMNARFGVDTSNEPRVRDFKASLAAKDLHVRLARRGEDSLRRVGEAIERIRRQNQKKPNQ